MCKDESSIPLPGDQSYVSNEEKKSEGGDEEDNTEEAEEFEQITDDEHDSDEDETSSMPPSSNQSYVSNEDRESEDGDEEEDMEDRIRNNIEKEIQELCAMALIDAQGKKADKKREKQTYVWFVATQQDFRNPEWTHGNNDAFLILPKKAYEKFVRLQKVRHCTTWGEVQDLGSDIYSEALYWYNFSQEKDEEWEHVRSMARDHPLDGYGDFNDDGDWPLFPPFLLQEMADHVRSTKDETHSWLDKYDDTDFTSFRGDFAPLIINSNQKDLILLEIEASNDAAEEESGFGALLDEEAEL